MKVASLVRWTLRLHLQHGSEEACGSKPILALWWHTTVSLDFLVLIVVDDHGTEASLGH